jgi:DHA1 family multidrug resistance protein-like MFS transporter
MPHWKRNLIVLASSQMLTLIGFSSYLSFIPYYIQEMGVTNNAELLSWVAAFSSASAVSMMIAAPIWGGLSDRYGRKVMLVRATLAGVVLAFLMGLARTPLQLLIVRVLQGAMGGTIAAAITLVATETPETNLGTGLGMMQTVQFLGQAVGPVLGGILADALGYRAVFPISSAIMAVSLVCIVTLVRERNPTRASQRARAAGPKAPLRALLTRTTVILLACIGIIRFGTLVQNPIVPLYVQSLATDQSRLATLAGTVTSITALTSALAALAAGRLGDRFGQKRVLTASTVFIAILFIPQAFVSTIGQLMLIRGVQGIFLGGTMPTTNALLAKSSVPSRRGVIFGLSSSVQAGGRALGPLAGAAVAQAWGMPQSFLFTAGVFGLIAVMVSALVPAHFAALAEESVSGPEETPSSASTCRGATPAR